MNDLTTLAYELGDLIDSMPEFDADSIYYTWEDKDEGEIKLRFNAKTGKWSSSEAFEEFFRLWLGFATVYSKGRDREVANKIAQPEAAKLETKMTQIVEANNDN